MDSRRSLPPVLPTFFFNNCFKNGFLPITLSEEQVDQLFAAVKAQPGYKLTIDLEKMVVKNEDASLVFTFAIDPFRQYCLMNGLDDIDFLLSNKDKIEEWEKKA